MATQAACVNPRVLPPNVLFVGSTSKTQVSAAITDVQSKTS